MAEWALLIEARRSDAIVTVGVGICTAGQVVNGGVEKMVQIVWYRTKTNPRQLF